MAGETKITTDHETIRKWAEERGGRPSSVARTAGRGDAGLLRITFPGYGAEGSLSEVSWDDFFHKFDDKKLEFVYQEQTRDGRESRFFKFVRRGQAARRRRAA